MVMLMCLIDLQTFTHNANIVIAMAFLSLPLASPFISRLRSLSNHKASLKSLEQTLKIPGRLVSSTPRDHGDGDGNGSDDVCLMSERHLYQSWPSEEHAAFAFARLAKPGHTTIGPSEFISVLKRMQLDYNLGDHELRRVFDSLDANKDGRLCLEEFKLGRGDHPFAKTLVESLSGSCPLYTADQFPDPNFDCEVSTAEFYSAPLDHGFVGEYVAIRKSLDYKYHNNYTKRRQYFQDSLIKSNVLLDGSRSRQPW